MVLSSFPIGSFDPVDNELGIFKWDTKPDTNQGNSNTNQSNSNQLPMLLKPYGSSQSLEQTVNKFLNNE